MKYVVLLFLINSAYGSFSIKKEELQNRRPGLVSQSISKRLARAYEYMANNSYGEAIGILKRSADNISDNNFAKAKIKHTLAYAYAQNSQYKMAQKTFTEVLKLNTLPLEPTLQTMFSLAQLKAMDKKHQEALKLMITWNSLAQKITPDALVFTATLYHELKNDIKALELVEKAIKMSSAPKENWLLFAVSLHYEKENYQKAETYLKYLAELSPNKKAYWEQLAGTLINQGKEVQATAIMGLALKLDLLKEESEILNITSLYLNTGMPYQAAKLLEKSLKANKIKNSKKIYELLATSYASARESSKAMPYLEKAAKLSQDGKLYAYQANLLLQEEDWSKALKAFDKALQKGKIKEMGNLYIGKGIALMQLKKFEEAKSNLTKAINFSKVQKQAQKWLAYLESL